jgi:hypothetical protein
VFKPNFLRRVIVGAMLLAAPALLAQTKVYGSYWEWPNIFDNNGTFNFTNGGGSNPQWNLGFNVPSGHLWAYPASIRGYHYGYNPAGDKLFPKQMTSISSIPAQFSYQVLQTGGGTTIKGDFTYDMFLRYDANTSTTVNPQAEVMVWGDNASYPISTTGQPVIYSAVTQSGRTWDLYYGYNSAAGYPTYSFLPHRTTVPTSLPASGSINVDLRPFFTVLDNWNEGGYNKYMYLDVVEAGFEITQGHGGIATTYFTVDAY